MVDATVRLVPTDGTETRFTIGGKTNVSGVAEIKTDIEWRGVPKGKYKVCISKLVVPEMTEYKEVPKDPDEYEKYTKALQAKSKETISVVDSKYNTPGTTPLIIEVTESGFKETIDVGAAVSNSLDSVAPSSGSGKKR
ncbi:MAG: hypothetical protein LBU65_15490 [Planctomycetaceae bacterium]|jgi:hypothetical protein|nr:hypothetical protein [Planctomycetaceae bacterium]